jgi:membrane associated rhomboid family serine protease
MSWLSRRDNSSDFAYAPEKGDGFYVTPFLFVIFLWTVFWLDYRYDWEIFHLGIYPRHLKGLIGVILSPIIHGSLSHLGSNSLPIIVLGSALFYFYPKLAYRIVIMSWLGSGLLTWIIARESYHIGASGLIYALAAFIFLSGVLKRNTNLLALSLLVAFLYGSLVWGVIPHDEGVSWEAHLTGGIAGFILAWRYRGVGPAQRKYSWDYEEESVEEEDENDIIGDAWKQYSGEHSIEYYYKPKEDKENNESS